MIDGYSSVDGVAQALRRARERGRSATLLLGAGCTASGGTGSTAACTAIARLVADGVVDRVLTVASDTTLLQATIAAGAVPAIYDLAVCRSFRALPGDEPTFVFLNGQGARRLDLDDERERRLHIRRLKAVFDDAVAGDRVWIVAGFSGADAPCLTRLASLRRSDPALFWLAYGHEAPIDDVSHMLRRHRNAALVRGSDAATFFTGIVERLGLTDGADSVPSMTELPATAETPIAQSYIRQGNALAAQARGQDDAAAGALLFEACRKFEAAVSVRPSDPEALYCYGLALARQARLAAPAEAESLLVAAIEKLTAAEKARPGIAAYFLACLTASRGDRAACQRFLEASQRHSTLPPVAVVENNPAFRTVREETWFQGLLRAA